MSVATAGKRQLAASSATVNRRIARRVADGRRFRSRAIRLELRLPIPPRCIRRIDERLAEPEQKAGLESFLAEYSGILMFLAVAIGLGLLLLLAAGIIAVYRPDPEKVSAYECGFNAFDDARMKFDVRFYLVAILFIIFDLEVAFLFPWAAAFKDIGPFGFWSMMVFLAILTVGFVYEWKKGALEWE